MQNSSTLESGAKAAEPALQNFLNRIFRCRHRHKTYPFTPRGEDQCYAVCLDCGQRVGADLLPKELPLKSTEPSGPPPATPVLAEAAANDSPPDMRLRNWYHVLSAGFFAVGLSGGLYIAHQPHDNPGAAAPAQTLPVSACIQPPVTEPKAPNKVSVATPPPGALKSRARVAPSGGPETSRLQGKTPFVVLGLDAPAVLELSKDPGRLHDLVQAGSLFTVPRGTAIRILDAENGVMKVQILDGPMTAREGWVQASQIAPRPN